MTLRQSFTTYPPVFTGLVETKGTLLRIARSGRGDDARLVIQGDFVQSAVDPIVLGESIAVDGVCLTVDVIVAQGGDGKPCIFEVDASPETLARTTIGDLSPGGAVNLERAMRLGGRMGGHIVSGHVDGVGRVVERAALGNAVKMTFEVPPELARFVAPKGSIAVSGVSLTVNGVHGNRFDVALIPHTQERTSLHALPLQARVNLEVDVVARYVARLLDRAGDGPTSHSNDATLLERLKSSGYV